MFVSERGRLYVPLLKDSYFCFPLSNLGGSRGFTMYPGEKSIKTVRIGDN